MEQQWMLDQVSKAFPNPAWNINSRESGKALWVTINDGTNSNNSQFQLQITPEEGVGVSVIESTHSDLAGHDEVFDELNEALTYLKGLV